MTTQKKERLLSLDTLRGFDMIWIVGLGSLFMQLGDNTDSVFLDLIAKHMHHAPWHHFYFFDLIFPLFMFMSGAAIPYALMSKIEKGTAKKKLYLKVLKRAAILVFLGTIYNGMLQFQFSTLRVASVLGQIGIAYLIAAIISVNFTSFRSIAFWIIGILLGYTAVHLLVAAPGHEAGDLSAMGSINGYIDRLLLPGKPLSKWGDPEGILSILSASSVTLMGVLAGILLRSGKQKQIIKVAILASIGIAMIILALVGAPYYPIIKAYWTSTYNLLAGGWSFLLLALFYLVIDVWKYQKWTFFFRVIGLNSITIYMANCMVDFYATSHFIFGGIEKLSGDLGSVITAAGVLILEWLVLYFLYKKGIFLKV